MHQPLYILVILMLIYALCNYSSSENMMSVDQIMAAIEEYEDEEEY